MRVTPYILQKYPKIEQPLPEPWTRNDWKMKLRLNTTKNFDTVRLHPKL